ncbi:hypothetical protein B0A55_08290 [Friedmanniomyces simplex]|uniref:Uncharacterized protein n=1 Tax=Friedmanniomyces simplex TaxID=329884 RepID=A0A4U0WZ15_9PEZI|nr:hypothetical protein B0A55_08290 [Friedmanniomyces simplex]
MLLLPGLTCLFAISIIALVLSYRSPPSPNETISESLGSWPRQNASRYANAYQLDPPPTAPPYGAVVAAARSTDDVTWMASIEQNWTTFPYDVDTPHNDADPRLHLPAAKGHEAIVYLTWLIAHYDALPWHAVFVHGHRDAWHQPEDIVHLITGLKRPALARAGYVSLRCDWYPSCPAEIRPLDHDAVVWGPGVWRNEAELAIAGNWRLLFPGEELPQTIAAPCCAQFAVIRQAILRRPKSDYERMRQWLMDTLLVDDVSGRVFEKLWAYILTGEAVQ